MELNHNPLNYQRDYVDKMKFEPYEKSICAAYELVMRNPKVVKLFKELVTLIQKGDAITMKLKNFTHIINFTDIDLEYFQNKQIYSQNLHLYQQYGIQNVAMDTIIYLILKEKSLTHEFYRSKYEKRIKVNDLIAKLFSDIDLFINDQQSIHDKEIVIQKLLDMCHCLVQQKDTTISQNIKGIEVIYNKFIKMKKNIDVQSSNKIKQIESKSKQNEKMYKRKVSLDIYKIYKNDTNIVIDLEHEQKKLTIRSGLIQRELTNKYLIDIENILYFDYPFFNSDEKNILTNYFKKTSESFKKYQQDNFNKIMKTDGEELYKTEVISNDNFKISSIVEFDDSLFLQLSNLSFMDNDFIYKLINDYEANFIKFATTVQYNFSRPKLFSLKSNIFNIDINMNHSKSDILSQIGYLIDKYQKATEYKPKTAIAYLSTEFIKYNLDVKSNLSIPAPTMETILDKIHQLCYIYDAKQLGHSTKRITTDVPELSGGKIDQYYHYAKFLIEEKYYQTLIIGEPKE